MASLSKKQREKMLPLVSVIIPNYNHAPYLKERIDSVLSQTYKEFEVLILDDCSSDESKEIIESYRNNKHISNIVFNEKNTGNTFIQWNKGISLAKGKYIWIAESDDVAKPTFLERLVDELEKHPEAAFAFSHSHMIDQDSNVMKHDFNPGVQTGEAILWNSREFSINKMLKFNYVQNASMAIFRADLYPQIDSSYQNYRYCGDWAFWMYMAQKGKIIEVCDKLNFFRQHPNKVTNKSMSDGRRWRNQGPILKSFISLLELSKWQERCLRGRWARRLKHSELDNEQREEMRQLTPEIFGGNQSDIICYEIGKLFGFLK